ncbi:hypothetical protein LJC58_01530 [Lachnospiraceae bacterium OttesenSCG-928-D06]|nr:hypothetical protein [Lachnospiraceae bacterium OttesenSCG-928-D06]
MEAVEQKFDEMDVVKQFLNIMEQQSMREQSQDFMEVLRYIAGMQVQLGAMVEELQGVRTQLAEMQSSQPKPMKESLMDKMSLLEEKATRLSERLSDIKDHLLGTLEQAVSAFKEKGKREMNQILQKGISGAKKLLQNCREQIVEVLTDYEKTANQIDSIGDELKQVGNSVANVGRLLSGKGTKEVSEEKQGVGLTRAINMPVKKVIDGLRKSLDKIDQTFEKLDKASSKLEPDKNKDMGAKVSVKDKLSQMKTKSEQQKKEPEPTKGKSKAECL